jgi:O-antigen ligase
MAGFKERWGIQSNFQFMIIILVFAITGSASAWLSKPFCLLLGITKEEMGFWFTPIRLLLIFPIYQVLLVAIGFLFGQFKFFWAFEKKMLRSLGLGIILPKENHRK